MNKQSSLKQGLSEKTAKRCSTPLVRGFTLVEILIVIGILAVLATVTVLILNPAQFIAQSRDSTRMNDLQSLNKAIVLSKAMGSFVDSTEEKKVYVSLPDISEPPNPNDDCRASGEYPTLPALATGWEYRCVASRDNLKKIDGNGWIPINFASVPSIQPPLVTLPVDPINDPTSLNYYAYGWDTDRNAYILAAKLDSDKYLSDSAAKDGGNDDDVFETRPIAWMTTPWACGGTLTDSRDSKTYATVQIGNQCWMAANFNVGTKLASGSTMPSDPFDYNNPEKWCYNNDDALCTSEGGLYTWAEMMGFSSSCLTTDCSGQIQSPHQGICLSGWHIPTDSEWTTLTDYLSANSQYWCGENSTYIAKSLASASGWSTSTNTCAVGNDQGTNNTTGFTVGPAGYRYANGDYSPRRYTYLWTASQYSATGSWVRGLGYSDAAVDRGYGNKAYGFSVRCVRD